MTMTAEQLYRRYVEAAGNAMRDRIRTGELTARERHALSFMTRTGDEVIDLAPQGHWIDNWPQLASVARRMADTWAELTSCAPQYGGMERVELGDRAWRYWNQDLLDRHRKAVR